MERIQHSAQVYKFQKPGMEPIIVHINDPDFDLLSATCTSREPLFNESEKQAMMRTSMSAIQEWCPFKED